MTFTRMMNMQNVYLAHHGVKGMKWGVRSAETLRKYGIGTGAKATGKSRAVKLTDGTIGYRHDLTYKDASGNKVSTGYVGFTKKEAKAGARRAMLEKVGDDKNTTTRLMRAQVKLADRREYNDMIKAGTRKQKALNAKTAKQLYKYADTLSNDELNRQLSRVNTMQQVKALKASQVSTGRKVARQVLTSVATQTATSALTKQLAPYADIGAEYVTKKVVGAGASAVVKASPSLKNAKTAVYNAAAPYVMR